MTSLIISENLAQGVDENYPVAGQDNDSQGFRDNFTSIKNGLIAAGDEITELQINTAKINEDNNFNGSLIDNAITNRLYGVEYDNGVVSGAVTIDVSLGEYQLFVLSNNTTFTFANVTDLESVNTKLRISIRPESNVNYTATFLTANGSVISENSTSSFNTGTDPNVSKVFEAWTQTNSVGGYDIYLNVLQQTNFYTGTVEALSGTTIDDGSSVAIFKTTTNSNTTLSAGKEGQIKTLIMDTYGGNMGVTVSNNGWGGAGLITFTGVGQTCTLQFINDKWFIISNNGVTVI